MARTEVGSAYVSIYPDTSAFGDDLAKALNAVNLDSEGERLGTSTSRGFADGFGSAFTEMSDKISSVVSGIVGTVGDFVGENFMKGVERFDTIQNFPKLMQTFGFSAEDASKSVEQVADHLVGLPGSTDEVLRLVQALSDSTGSLDLATGAGIAFNDMLTASGADTASATLAMRTFDQIMGGGTITTQRWQSLVSKMPLQMSMLAESLLGAGASSQDLGEALANGDITLQEFAQGMSDLSPQFEEQARAMSNGVGTAMTNMGNRVAAGWAEILEAVGQTEISDAINGFANLVKDAMYGAADGIKWLKEQIEKSGIPEILGRIGAQIQDWFSKFDPTPIQNFVSGGLDVLKNVLQWISDHGDIVSSVLAGIGAAIGTIWVIGKLASLVSTISSIISFIMMNPLAAVVIAIAAVVAALVNFFANTEEGQKIWNDFITFITPALEVIGGILDTIGRVAADVIAAVANFFLGVGDAIASFFGDTEADAESSGGAIKGTVEGIFDKNPILSLGKGLANAAKGIWNGIKNTAKNIWGGIKNAIGDKAKEIATNAKKNWDTLKQNASTIWNGVKDTAKNIWGGIKSAITDKAKEIATNAKNNWNTLKTNASNIWNGVKSVASSVWGGIKDTVVNKAKDIVNNAKSNWDTLKTNASNIWNGVKSVASSVWGGIKTAVTDKAKEIVNNAKSNWDTMKTNASNIWNGVKSTASSIWGGIKSAITDKAKSIVSETKGKWDTLKTNASNIWNGIKGAASSIWDGIKNTITNKMQGASNGVKSSVDTAQKKINSLKGKTVDLNANNKVNNPVDSSQRKVNTLKGKTVSLGAEKSSWFNSTIDGAQRKINGLYGKTVTASINVQKTGISRVWAEGTLAGGGLSVWTRAAGGIVTAPQLNIVGEAGDEAIIPLNNRNHVRPFARAVAAEMGGGTKASEMVVNVYNPVVRNDHDIDLIANRINQKVNRERAGAL